MNFRKKKVLIEVILLGFLGSLIFPCFNPRLVTATLIWEDDFDDGNYDGWTIHNGTFSAANNYLLANFSEGEWHLASHASNVAYGTWSFDILVVNNENMQTNEFSAINFICNSIDQQLWWTGSSDSYILYIHQQNIKLWRSIGAEWIEYRYVLVNYDHWYHIDITRDNQGQFYVFLDGSVVIWAKDNNITTSNYFTFGYSKGNYAIDNITVSDEITIFPKIADLQFHTEDLSVTVDQGSDKEVSFWVHNYGDLKGSCNLSVGTVPSGLSVTLDSENVTDLSLFVRGYSKRIRATIEASPTCNPGDYSIPIEARNSTHLLDTLTLSVNVEGEEPTTTTTTTTTSDDTTTTSKAGRFSGFIPILIFFATIVMITRKRKKR